MSDEQLQSTPYEIKPGEPRLTGLLAFNGSLAWVAHRTRDQLEIVPDAWSARWQIRFLIGLTIAIPILCAVAFLWLKRPGDSPWWCLAFMAGGMWIGLFLLGAASWIRGTLEQNIRAGPLVRAGPEGDIEFPRYTQTISRADAIHWEIVHGRWLRAQGPYGSMSGPHEEVWELQLVYRDGERTMVQPVVGSQGNVSRIARELSEVSGIPLQRLDEPESFFWWRNPFEAKPPGASK